MGPLATSVDILLNVTWLAFFLTGLGVLAASETRRQDSRGRLRRITAVFVLTIALFPMISASDDELSFSRFRTQHRGVGVPADERERTNDNLARLFDILDAFQIQAFWSLAVTFCFFALSSLLFAAVREQHLVCAIGRAPPVTA